MRFDYYFLLILIVMISFSCVKTKKADQTINVNIMDNDSVIKTVLTRVDEKFKFLGKNKDYRLIIKDSTTLKKSKGSFACGIYVKENPINKVFCFLTNKNYELPNLSSKDSILKFCLIDEYKTITNTKNISYEVIENYSDLYGDYNGKHLSFAFLNKNKDTIGFQNTFFLVVNEKLFTINYLNDTRENYNDIREAFEDFAIYATEE